MGGAKLHGLYLTSPFSSRTSYRHCAAFPQTYNSAYSQNSRNAHIKRVKSGGKETWKIENYEKFFTMHKMG